MKTLKVKKFNPVVGMNDEEILDYLIDCFREDTASCETYARAIEFVCEARGMGSAFVFNNLATSRVTQQMNKISSGTLLKHQPA